MKNRISEQKPMRTLEELEHHAGAPLPKGTWNLFSSVGEEDSALYPHETWMIRQAQSLSDEGQHVLYIAGEQSVSDYLLELQGTLNLDAFSIVERDVLTPAEFEGRIFGHYEKFGGFPSYVLIENLDLLEDDYKTMGRSPETFERIIDAFSFEMKEYDNLTFLIGSPYPDNYKNVKDPEAYRSFYKRYGNGAKQFCNGFRITENEDIVPVI
ncbi:hypothetical protein IMZ31_18875 (plasmid) [Pontibacillus sp. ALD_SL1]|uniref:hypothetical protein n=1 Tax=Pontibacillus sp. ALD_SL1 TaxID=2777185 RepID=UPI001A97AE98|nr:hypothetical protein [Pontibacillus sp. ALD_SL1]QST02613.1 hypothetical protein IMZ31_18875 [Pontibacillus sp. ALD_SL1]